MRYALTFGRGAHRYELHQRARQLALQEIDKPDLLFVADERTPYLTGDASLVVGQLFSPDNRRRHELPTVLLDPANRANLSKLDGLWGNFVLFFSADEQPGVYRDPSAGVPVYRCGSGYEAIFVSDAELATELGLLERASPDSAFPVHWLQFPFLRSARTGFEGVTEILPGMLHELDHRGRWTVRPVWRPANFVAAGQAITDPAEAAIRLREVALAVVPAQMEGSAALQLSGGLDSSIVAACLASAGRNFECVNFATRSPDGDERDFARAVAETYRLPLRELQEPSAIGLTSPPLRAFRPTTNPLLQPFDTAISEAAGELRTDLLVDGAGGDNLFCYITSAAPVVDALRWGSLAQARATIADIALRANCTWWEVTRAALGRLRPRASWKEDRNFVRRELLLKKPDPHPWLEGLRSVPPGKREHIHALVHIQHFLDRRSAGIALSHPLLAQPLLELCLRIPSWLWMRGGRNRAIARDAFAKMLPASVLTRRAKGSLQSLFYRSFSHLRGEILDALMAGTLKSQGIIDASQIEAVLTSDEWRLDDAQLRISEILALELWLQSWKS